ncbi:hypothetical protein GJ744_006877 [Endocarpon pusillum]|uniref:Uncharacterized protein n=1 Tax=Endocarpon pusillum TaxID=364733 RepID=A0A8H7A423_9EURO|nr:hypothetical protein GJ744_006877 [Endocarpon pusillum]
MLAIVESYGPSRQPEFKGGEEISEAGPSLSQILLAGEERAKQRRGLDERMNHDVTIGLLTTSVAESSGKAEASREQGKATPPKAQKRRKRLASRAQASQMRDAVPVLEIPMANPQQEARLATEEISPYDKVPDALISHLLSLQSRDAWCKQAS